MDAGLGLSQSLRTEQNLSPQMLQSLALLPMPILELKAHIQAEIEANPALEIPDSEFALTQEGPSDERTLDDRMDDADTPITRTCPTPRIPTLTHILIQKPQTAIR